MLSSNVQTVSLYSISQQFEFSFGSFSNFLACSLYSIASQRRSAFKRVQCIHTTASMMIKFFTFAAVASMASAAKMFSRIEILNTCTHQVDLYDNHNTVPLSPGATENRTLEVGYKGIFRHGADPQATLAEFTIDGGSAKHPPGAWFDISIIPTAPNQGPEYCPSLEDCKRFTGGTGYNIQMQIAPKDHINGKNCRVLTCMHDGCEDAYQFPKDDTKTHDCPIGTDFHVTFCPGGTGGQTPAPTMPAPTNATEERSIDDLIGAGIVDSSKSAADESAVIDTPAPTTETPVEVGTESPAVEANTQSEANASSRVGTVFIVLGGVAAVAGVAMIVVIRRKKAALDAMEDKNSIALRTSMAVL